MICANIKEGILRKRTIEEERNVRSDLRKSLSAFHLVYYGVTVMIGAGLYVITGSIIKDMAGPAACFSYLICSVAILFTGICFVEFATLLPRAGSCYTYTYVVMGELPAFIIGWALMTAGVVNTAILAQSISGNIDILTNHTISNFTSAYFYNLNTSDNNIISAGLLQPTPDILAFGLLLFPVVLTGLGSNLSMNFTVVVSTIQILMLTTICISCFVYGSIDNWSSAGGGFFPFGFGGIILGSTTAIYAFGSFELVTVTAEECKNPRRDIPIGFFGSLGISIIFDMFAALAMSYLVAKDDVVSDSIFYAGFQLVGADFMKWLSLVATLTATVSGFIAGTFVMPRLIYALAFDGLIFKSLAHVSSKTGVPIVSLVIGTIVSLVLCLFISTETLIGMCTLCTLLNYYIIGIDLMLLRYPSGSATNEGDYQLRISNNMSQKALKLMFMISMGLYLVGCLAIALIVDFQPAVNLWYTWIAAAAAVLLTVGSLIVLTLYEPKILAEDCYQAPLMPMAPLLTIFFTGTILVKVLPRFWLLDFLWILVGVVIYIFYGLTHSTARTGNEYEEITDCEAIN